MKASVFSMLAVLAFSVIGFAAPKAVVLKDGSVAKCDSLADVSKRAFRITVVSSSEDLVTIKLDTLVCAALDDNRSVKLMPLTLGRSLTFHDRDGGKDSMTYTIKRASLQIVNDAETDLVRNIDIDINAASQLIAIKLPLGNNLSRVDMTIISLETIFLNDKFFDQGEIFGGNYRLFLNR